MCLGGGGVAKAQVAEREYQNRPVTVSGTQIGVDNPKDTKKATEELKIQRQKKEGTYVDPNLTTAKKLTSRSGMSQADRKARKDRQQKAKDAAKARMRSKFKSSPTGRKTGVA